MLARDCFGVVACRVSKGRGGVGGRAGVSGSVSSCGGMAGLGYKVAGKYGG